MKVIGVLGFKGAGKDTASSALVDNYGFSRFAFANPLKDTLSAMFGWDRGLLEGNTDEGRIWRETVDVWWAKRLGISDFTPRKAMTLIGSDVIRKYFHDDIWLANVERVLVSGNYDKVVITDCRFRHEADLLKSFNATFIRIDTEFPEFWDITSEAVTQDQYANACLYMETNYPYVHKSEWEWNYLEPHFVIRNDSTKEALQESMIEVYNHIHE